MKPKQTSEPHDHLFECSFGFRIAVTENEFNFYSLLKTLAMREEIDMYSYLVAQWGMIREGWIQID